MQCKLITFYSSQYSFSKTFLWFFSYLLFLVQALCPHSVLKTNSVTWLGDFSFLGSGFVPSQCSKNLISVTSVCFLIAATTRYFAWNQLISNLVLSGRLIDAIPFLTIMLKSSNQIFKVNVILYIPINQQGSQKCMQIQYCGLIKVK